MMFWGLPFSKCLGFQLPGWKTAESCDSAYMHRKHRCLSEKWEIYCRNFGTYTFSSATHTSFPSSNKQDKEDILMIWKVCGTLFTHQVCSCVQKREKICFLAIYIFRAKENWLRFTSYFFFYIHYIFHLIALCFEPPLAHRYPPEGAFQIWTLTEMNHVSSWTPPRQEDNCSTPIISTTAA